MHAKNFICYIRILYYIYYMSLKVLTQDPLDDGWNEPEDIYPRHLTDLRHVSVMSAGDTVLYSSDGKVSPAVLIEPAGDDCWLARDARSTQGMIYLDKESISACLPPTDLLGGAA